MLPIQSRYSMWNQLRQNKRGLGVGGGRVRKKKGKQYEQSILLWFRLFSTLSMNRSFQVFLVNPMPASSQLQTIPASSIVHDSSREDRSYVFLIPYEFNLFGTFFSSILFIFLFFHMSLLSNFLSSLQSLYNSRRCIGVSLEYLYLYIILFNFLVYNRQVLK